MVVQLHLTCRDHCFAWFSSAKFISSKNMIIFLYGIEEPSKMCPDLNEWRLSSVGWGTPLDLGRHGFESCWSLNLSSGLLCSEYLCIEKSTMFCNKCIEKSFIVDIPFNFEIKFSLINPLSYHDVYTYGVYQNLGFWMLWKQFLQEADEFTYKSNPPKQLLGKFNCFWTLACQNGGH